MSEATRNTTFILGNWKMNLLRAEAQVLVRALVSYAVPEHTEVALFPPFTALAAVAEGLTGSRIALGAQDCSAQPEGAYTGEVSAPMLRDAGCRYVILGHSERRSLHGEDDALVKRKAAVAMDEGLIPVICVGESLSDRESGRHLEVIASQIRGSLPFFGHSDGYLIAYEPVWAIGSGKIPSGAEISEAHKTIASLLSYGTSKAHTAIAYGGSVNAANARAILSTEGVDGVLVGGASLKAESFGAILAAAQ